MIKCARIAIAFITIDKSFGSCDPLTTKKNDDKQFCYRLYIYNIHCVTILDYISYKSYRFNSLRFDSFGELQFEGKKKLSKRTNEQFKYNKTGYFSKRKYGIRIVYIKNTQ